LSTYVIVIHQRHRQTDGRTDDMQSQYRALHYSASHGKNDDNYLLQQKSLLPITCLPALQ